MNLLIIAAVTNILFHPYWETGNYTSNTVANLIGRYPDKYSWAMTNQVHWMKAHTTTNGPSFHIGSWAQYGWTTFEWTDDLSADWGRINCNHAQYSGVNTFKVYMHPESELTKRMLRSPTGFFRQTTHWQSETLSVDMTGFWPEFIGPMPLPIKKSMPPIPGGK